MHYKYQSPWFIEALQSEGKLEINELKTDITSDICIVGGGFTGLWTALKIKEKKPSINITIIEKDLCGSGASGRNGGCMIPQSTKFTAMKNTIGIKDAKKMVNATEDAVYNIRDYCIQNNIDAKIRINGVVYAATNKSHEGAFENLIDDLKENKINNWERLTDDSNQNKKNLIQNNIKKDWTFEERLSKEFEAIGFFISDHPINEYKEVFDIYKIQNFNSFMISSKNEAILAATIMKIQEKKTRDGNPFAIVKFSDLGGVFELFIFSEILEQNRNILKEGKSFLITVLKDLSNLNNRFKRISVRKLVSLNEISNQSIPKITFEIEKLENLKNFSNLISEKGNTNVKIVVKNNSKNLIFELSEKRKINPEILKSLKNEPYLKRINI